MSEQISTNLKYKLINNNTEYEVINNNDKTDTNIIIPPTYNGKPVTSIRYGAFEYCSKLTSVIIPNSVKSIGSYAFYGCNKLTNVTIPESVTNIGDFAFADCSELTKVNYLGNIDSWAQIKFENYAANPLWRAKNLYINDVLVTEANITTATKINDYAFFSCSGLTTVTIGNSVTSIGGYAFRGCSGLTSVVIPDSVTSIGDQAFYNCPCVVKDNNGTNYVDKWLISCNNSAATKIDIKEDIKGIADNAFIYCTQLTNIKIPNGITNIGAGVFDYCTKLTSIELPKTIKRIGKYIINN